MPKALLQETRVRFSHQVLVLEASSTATGDWLVQVERGSYINVIGSLFDILYLLVFSVCLQVLSDFFHKSRVHYIARISGG
jgi:hypothetical protein